MSPHATLEHSLLTAYKEIHRTVAPEWAVHKITLGKTDELVVPTIPFVGKDFLKQPKRVLVYASAENLTNHWVGQTSDRIWIDEDTKAFNRHRICFDNQEMQQQKHADTIPYVHCGPMETGLLLTAVMYIANQLNIMDLSGVTPRDFCEKIAFGNYGKYSKETPHQLCKRLNISKQDAKQNIDYAGNVSLMEVSHPFIEADIRSLQPDYIVLPETMYRAAKKFIDSIKGDAVIIPIYQMLAGNVNNYIAPNKRNKNIYKKYCECDLHPAVRKAFGAMTTVTLDKYLYAFGYLDDVLSSLDKK